MLARPTQRGGVSSSHSVKIRYAEKIIGPRVNTKKPISQGMIAM